MSSHDKLFAGLDEVGKEARHLILDSLYCDIFNLSNDLTGNLAENDIHWLAREIWFRSDWAHDRGRYDDLPESEREHWEEITRASITAMGMFMGRVADRCQAHAKVLHELLRADRAEQKRRREEGER